VKRKNLIVVSQTPISYGKSAASARVRNIARAVARRDITVYLTSVEASMSQEALVPVELERNIFALERPSVEGNDSDYWRRLTRTPRNLWLALRYVRRVAHLASTLEGQTAIYYYPLTMVSMDLLVLSLLKAACGLPVYCEVNELWTATLAVRPLPESAVRKAYHRLLLRSDFAKYKLGEFMSMGFDGLLTISTALVSHYERYSHRIFRLPILSSADNQPDFGPRSFDSTVPFRLAFAGYVGIRKEGIDLLLRAVAVLRDHFDNFVLDLYGFIPPPDRQTILERLPAELGLEGKVVYHGMLEQEEVAHRLAQSHLLLLPRPSNPQTDYGFSTKLAEYMVSGVPVLATEVSDNSLYLVDGENCHLVSPGSATLFGAKLIQIVDGYRDNAERIARNAWDTARRDFHYSVHAKSLERFFFPEHPE